MAKRGPRTQRLYRAIGYPIQAVVACITFGFFSFLPVDWASGFGGWLARTVGPRLRVTQRADRNLRRALPDLNNNDIAKVIRDMWDNLGRIVGEMPHLEKIADRTRGGRIEIIGEEFINAIRKNDSACIFFSGHLANWEVFGPAAKSVGLPYTQVYRAANNPFVDAMLRRIRNFDQDNSVPKGPKGARAVVAAVKAGRRLAMLVDQKMNNGIAVPFFGHDAMTAPALADLSLRYDCPAIPVRIERVAGCHFRVHIHPPLTPPSTGDRKKDTAAMMLAVNNQLEDWIRDRPGQWLWLHNRWPDV